MFDLSERGLRRPKSEKSSIDIKRRDLEFKVHDWVYLNISPMMV